MAKVDKITIEWLGNWQDFEVHFTKKNSFHIKNCPYEIIKFSEDKFFNKSDTLHELTTWFKHYASVAEQKMKSIEKVILITFSVGSEIYTILTGQSKGSYMVDRDNPLSRFLGSGMSDSIRGIGFSISYEVAQKITYGDKTEYYRPGINDYNHRFGLIHRKANMVEVPFSEAAEDTIKGIQKNLIDMVKKLTMFFSQKEEQISNILESGKLMLNEKND